MTGRSTRERPRGCGRPAARRPVNTPRASARRYEGRRASEHDRHHQLEDEQPLADAVEVGARHSMTLLEDVLPLRAAPTGTPAPRGPSGTDRAEQDARRRPSRSARAARRRPSAVEAATEGGQTTRTEAEREGAVAVDPDPARSARASGDRGRPPWRGARAARHTRPTMNGRSAHSPAPTPRNERRRRQAQRRGRPPGARSRQPRPARRAASSPTTMRTAAEAAEALRGRVEQRDQPALHHPGLPRRGEGVRVVAGHRCRCRGSAARWRGA